MHFCPEVSQYCGCRIAAPPGYFLVQSNRYSQEETVRMRPAIRALPAAPVDPLTDAEERRALDLLLRGFQVSRMLRLVADLGVAEKIAPDRTISINELAAACSVRPEQLIRVLRALAAFGVFKVTADGTVGHTARSQLLRPDYPRSMHHSARFWAAPGSWKAWGMLDVAMNGASPFEAAWNMSRFGYLAQSPDEARTFDAMMAAFPDNRHAGIAAAYDFSGARLITDIGGGNGATLQQILSRFPDARGLILEREDVIAALSADELMNGRIVARAGSFFEKVPPGADVYLLVRVLHDWKDEDCLCILRACRKAMRPDSKLLIGDELLEADPMRGKAVTYLLDTQMMAMFGSARERSEAEFRHLLRASGFELRRVIATASAVSIIEAIPGPVSSAG
jgi:hypothetical protein